MNGLKIGSHEIHLNSVLLDKNKHVMEYLKYRNRVKYLCLKYLHGRFTHKILFNVFNWPHVHENLDWSLFFNKNRDKNTKLIVDIELEFTSRKYSSSRHTRIFMSSRHTRIFTWKIFFAETLHLLNNYQYMDQN